jgi:hypothetical protein
VHRLIDFEHKSKPIASRRAFAGRVGHNAAIAFLIIITSLAVGIAGYMHFEDMSFIDAFLNAAMILSTMGPVAQLKTEGGKIFAGLYAIASGLLLFAIAGLLLAPVYHRMIHRFHLGDDEDDGRLKTEARSQKSKKR